MENRLYLRAFEPDDYKTIIKWRRDEEINSMLGGTKYYLAPDGFYYPMSELEHVWDDPAGYRVYGFPAGTTRYKIKSTSGVTTTMYAKGTTGTKRNQWAITDEPQFGDELVLVPTAQGNLSYMRKGTSVIPADLAANLMEW